MMSSTTDNIIEDETMTGKSLEIFILEKHTFFLCLYRIRQSEKFSDIKSIIR
jgi:hypothetical protein